MRQRNKPAAVKPVVKPDYQILSSQPSCTVYVIECVMPNDHGTGREIDEALENAMTELQAYGAAEIMTTNIVAGDFQHNCEILRVRARK